MFIPKKIVFLFLLVSLIFFIISFSNQKFYKHEKLVGTTFFYSDETEIEPFLKNFSKKQSYYLIAGIKRENNNLPQTVNNFVIPFTVVLSGNGKKVVTILQSFKDENFDCTTNFGENTVKILGKQQCTNYLREITLDETGVKLYVFPVKSSRSNSFALIEGNSIKFYPRKPSDLQKMSLNLLRFAFQNTDSILNKTKEAGKYFNILK